MEQQLTQWLFYHLGTFKSLARQLTVPLCNEFEIKGSVKNRAAFIDLPLVSVIEMVATIWSKRLHRNIYL